MGKGKGRARIRNEDVDDNGGRGSGDIVDFRKLDTVYLPMWTL